MNKVFRRIRNFVIVMSLFASGNAVAQSASDLKINEFLAINQTNYEDDYGVRGSWIEIYNTAYNWVDIAGCYLTNDPKNPRKYRIPKSDPVTKIAPRSYLVFWADNKPTHGTLHLNFDLKETNYLALYDQSGRVLIDSVTFNLAAQKSDISWGRLTDASSSWGYLPKTTPRSNNDTVERPTPGAKFLEYDPEGATMAVISMSVVFSALILLYLVFKIIGRINIRLANQANRRELEKQGITLSAEHVDETPAGEVFAAISTALYLYEHDRDDIDASILTIEKTARTYSPWSSKIYGLRQIPQRVPRQVVR